MYLKKLIGAFTALIMTVTVFAGFTVTANADETSKMNEEFNITYMCDTEEVKKETVYSNQEYETRSKAGYTLDVDERTYVVIDANRVLTGIEPTSGGYTVTYTCTINVQRLQSISIKISGNGGGTVSMNGTLFSESASYSVAAGNSISIAVTPNNGSYIKDISFGNTGTVNWNITESYAVATIEMPADGETLTVVFDELMPDDRSATLIRDFKDNEGYQGASLWTGELTGKGSAFSPEVYVKLKDNQEKTVTGSTTIAGKSSISIAVVVDRLGDEISEVILRGDPNPGNYPDSYSGNDSGETESGIETESEVE